MTWLRLCAIPFAAKKEPILEDGDFTNFAEGTSDDDSLTTEYVPGDVVEFKRNGAKQKGVLFRKYGTALGIIFPSVDEYLGLGWVSLNNYTVTKTGHTSLMPDNGVSINDCKSAIKQYFSTPIFTGSYAERQAQWVAHHGIKEGSKVKVVRKFEKYEDGSNCGRWDHANSKVLMQGQMCEVRFIKNLWIGLDAGEEDYWSLPYFVLEPVVL